eukprot:1141180-Rhodomonas_salina.1
MPNAWVAWYTRRRTAWYWINSGSAPSCLSPRYAVSGTDVAYRVARWTDVSVTRSNIRSHLALLPYAFATRCLLLPKFLLPYAFATQRLVLPSWVSSCFASPTVPRICYAMSGTDLAFSATRCPVLSYAFATQCPVLT